MFFILNLNFEDIHFELLFFPKYLLH